MTSHRLLWSSALVTAALLVGCSAAPENPLISPPPVSSTSAQSPSPTPSEGAAAGPVEAAADAMIAAGAVAVLIEARKGEEVVDVVRGEADQPAQRAATIADPLRIASISKIVVAVVMLKLVEGGTVDLDKPVGTYLPGGHRRPQHHRHRAAPA